MRTGARKSWFPVSLLVFLCLLPGVLGAEEPEEAPQGNWFERTTQRYLGADVPDDQDLEGQARELIDVYRAHQGKTIEVVIVSQVVNFSQGLDKDQKFSQRALSALTKPFQDYTHEWVIRDYLLFDRGDQVIPYDLADTERMLRELPFITDVRIHVLPLQGESGGVAVVVETQDRWPFGVSAIVHDQTRWEARLYTESLSGTGTHLSGTLLRKDGAPEKDWGYRFLLGKRNMLGAFLDGEMVVEDNYKKERRGLVLSRPLIHPGLHVIGSAGYEYVDNRENDGVPQVYNRADAWAGFVQRLYDHRTYTGSRRRVLIPALGWYAQDHKDRPVVTPDTNRSYHNRESLLVGLTYEQARSYKTSFFFQEGEVEDITAGFVAKISTGPEWREFDTRTALFFDTAAMWIRESGNMLNLGFSLGGYFKDDQFVDGILDLSTRYYTRLLGGTRYRTRLYLGLDYTVGIGRHPYDQLSLGDEAGLKGLDNNLVQGNQRFVMQGMARVFTPLDLLGFRMSFLLYGSGGVIGDVDAASLWQEKIYTSLGLGVRFRNPGLVLPTVQVVVYMVQKVDDQGLAFSVKIGSVGHPELKYPSSRPGTVAYR